MTERAISAELAGDLRPPEPAFEAARDDLARASAHPVGAAPELVADEVRLRANDVLDDAPIHCVEVDADRESLALARHQPDILNEADRRAAQRSA